LERETLIERPIETVFAFFSLAENLQRITPPDLSFEIKTPLPIEMAKGTLIDYRIRLMGVPMRWRTLISEWNPPYEFVDEQLKGPYLKWHHRHRFESVGDSTRMTDRVIYRVPGGPLEGLVHRMFIAPQLEKIFNHRQQAIKSLFE
jgi:ligand-binding SRPBCC domain-containing protein